MCVSTGPLFDGVGRGAVEAAAALGAPDAVQELSAEVRERCRSPLFRRGVLVPTSPRCSPRASRSACAGG